MGLHFIYGSSQSDRTGYLYDMVLKMAEEDPGKQYILLVPEQASLSVQKEMIVRSSNHALFNTDVLTFNRLSYRVFDDVNEKELTVLDDAEKGMLLRLVMKRMSGEDSLLRRNLNKKGFVEEIKSLISELVQYNVTPERLKGCLELLNDHPYLKDKLNQVTGVYEAFMTLLKDRYQMREERMTLLSRRIKDWEMLDRTVFFLDGFTGFTPPQTEVLKELMLRGKDVYVSLVLGTGSTLQDNRNEEDLFHMTYQCSSSLKEHAVMQGVAFDEITVQKKENRPDDLMELEQRLYRYPERVYDKEIPHINIVKTENRTKETEWLLSDVLKQIRSGREYRDLSVIVSDMGAYREDLEFLLEEAGVPYFYDENKDLSNDPEVMLLNALADILRSGFSFESVVHFIKNPLTVSYFEKNNDEEDRFSIYEQVCEFENFLLATGIKGKKAYEKEWVVPKRFSEIRMSRILKLKSILTELLFPLTERLSEDSPVKEKVTVIRDLLIKMNVTETLDEMAGEAEERKDPILKREYERVFETVEDLLQKMDLILGEEMLTREEFFDVLSSGLTEMRLSMLPPTIDRLVIGDLKRTRLADVKKLYILGANEGLFPAGGTESGFLSDVDRRILKERDIPLSPGLREENFNAQLYIYLALTHPTESLALSYALQDPDGKVLKESPVLAHMQDIFPKMKTENVRETVLTIPERGLSALSRALRKNRDERERGVESPEFSASERGLYHWIRSEKTYDKDLALIDKGLFYRYHKENLSDRMTGNLYQDSFNGSVSFFEQYASCAYRHFLSYGLKLSERQEYGLNAADFGTLFHESIDAFFRKMKEEGLSWNELTLEDRVRLSKDSVQEITESYTVSAYTENARNEYIMKRILRLTDRTLWALKDQWDKGKFTVTETEVRFRGGKDLPGMVLDLSEGLSLSLQGRIDRIDLSKDDEKIYVRVIDYKSGSTDLSYTKIFYGLQLQLLLYMQAAQELVQHKNPGKEIIPSGFYYYHIKDPVVEPKEGKDPEDLILDELKLSGVTNYDEQNLSVLDTSMDTVSSVVKGLKKTKSGFDKRSKIAGVKEFMLLQDYAKEKMQELTKRLFSGDISVDPYQYGKEDGCQYCSYKGICGFDDKVAGFRKRRLQEKELADLLGEDKNV